MPEKITQLQKELETIIKGKKAVTDKIIMAVLARGHILLEDVPGVGKTTTALALSRLMGMEFNSLHRMLFRLMSPDLPCMRNRPASSCTVRVR